jgi:hypothetical protein
MAKKEAENATKCPLCEVMDLLTAKCERLRASKFAQHVRTARTEMLMAVRSLIDERIEEMKKADAAPSRARRIQVKEAE